MLDHIADLDVGSTVLRALERAYAGGNRRIGVCAGGGSHPDGEGGVVTSAVLGVKNEHQVEGSGLELGVVRSLEHIEEILRQRQALLRMAKVEGSAQLLVPEHIVGVCDGCREL